MGKTYLIGCGEDISGCVRDEGESAVEGSQCGEGGRKEVEEGRTRGNL